MTFTARTREQLRDQLLADWQAEYRGLGIDLSVIPGSFAWLLANGIAINLMALEAYCATVRNEILPLTSSTEQLNNHGIADGVSREPATVARVTVTGTGTPSTTATLTGRTLRSASGVVFSPDASTAAISGAGAYTVSATAAVSGTASNLPVGASLQWDSLPTNVTTLLTTVSVVDVVANDLERDDDYAARIMERRRERPGSGNRSDWRAFTLAASGVSESYVYPLYDTAYGENTLGAVTVVCFGPAQGNSTTNTRLLSPAVLNNIVEYIEGNRDASGNVVSDGVQLRPASMPEGNYFIVAPTETPTDVDIRITEASAYAFPFTSALARSTASTTKVTVAGDQSALDGKAVLLYVGTANARGGYVARTITSVSVIAGPNTELNFDAAPVAPSNNGDGLCVYPQPPNYEQIRDAVFELFDNLGPGDTGTASRWPTEETTGRATLYPTSLDASLVRVRRGDGTTSGVAGVLATEVVAPAAPVTPTPLAVITLGELRIRP